MLTKNADRPFAASVATAMPTLRSGLTIAVVFIVCYVALAWATRMYMVRPFAVTPWHPAAGLGLALLLVYGIRFWPALAGASFLSNLLVRDLPLGLNVLAPAVVTAGYVGMAWLLTHRLAFSRKFDRPLDVFLLVIVAGAGTLIIALVFSFMLALHGAGAPLELAQVGLNFWIGHLIGIVVNTPLLLLLLNNRSQVRRSFARRFKLELAGQLAAVVIGLWIIFGLSWTDQYKFFYLLFLPLIWIVMRHGIVGAAVGVTVIQLGLIVAVESSHYQLGSTVTEFQFMMLVLAVTGLVLGATVTLEQVANDARDASESRLRTIVSTAPDGIITVDPQGRIIGANSVAIHMFGFDTDLAGLSVLDLLPGFEQIERRGEACEVVGLRRDGSRFPAELSIATSVVEDQHLRIAIARDISRRKEIDLELARKQKEINRMARLAAAGETAAALAHELHQPLAAVRNFAHAAQMVAGQGQAADLMNKVGLEAARAAEVVQRLRDFFSSGATRLERISLNALVSDGVQAMADEAARHGVALEMNIRDPEAELFVDRVQIQAVIHSLLSNAIESIAAHPAAERVVRVIAEHDHQGQIHCSVADTGGGIDKAMAARLFEPFATTKSRGTGFGLVMSRSLIEAHGGKLWVDADSKGGAMFHFTLPLVEAGRVANGG